MIENDRSHVKNFVCLLVKQYIYRQRCLGEKLTNQQFREHVLKVQNMEKYIAIKNSKSGKHQKKWSPDKETSQLALPLNDQDFINEYIDNM